MLFRFLAHTGLCERKSIINHSKGPIFFSRRQDNHQRNIPSRKVAAVSGDARRALALCSRALELAGPEGAGLKEVQQALGEAASSAAVRAIKNCSPAERLMLRAIAAEVRFMM